MNRSDWNTLRLGVNAEWSRLSVEFHQCGPLVGRAYWKRDSQIMRPTPIDSRPEGSFWHPNLPRPFKDRLRLAVMAQKHVASLVETLFQGGGPAAVLGAVRAVVVYPVKTKAGKILAVVVRNEKRYGPPSFADENTATSVINVSMVPTVMASRHHAFPNLEEGMLRKAMCSLTKGVQFISEASARCGGPANKRSLPNEPYRLSAVANYLYEASPIRGPIFANANDNQAPKALSNHLFHADKSITVVGCESRKVA